MDILLAAMGVILDAVPLFAEGSDLPGAGVLLAVHDRIGDPLFVVTAEANSAMTKMLLPVLEQARELIGPTRCITIVFDRAGWSPKLFQKILALNFDILTYSDDPMGSAG